MVLSVVCFAAGYVVGTRAAGETVTVTFDGPREATAEQDGAPAAADPPRASRPKATTVDTAAVEELSSRIAEARASRPPAPKIERPWPYAPGRDAATEWPDRMARLFDECGGEMEMVATECTDFPCVATVRADEWEPGLVVPLRKMFGDDCAALADDLPDSEHAVLMDFNVDCPDGATETMLVFATGDMGPLVDAFPEANDEDLVRRLMMDLGRRSEALAADWPCAE